MPAAQWSQWAASYAKDTLGGSTLGLLVRFSGVLHRQLVCTSGPLLSADPCGDQNLYPAQNLSTTLPVSFCGPQTQLHGFRCSMANKLKLRQRNSCLYSLPGRLSCK